MDNNIQAKVSKSGTSTKDMTEQTPTTSLMVNDASKPSKVRSYVATDTARSTSKKAEQLLLGQSVSRSEVRGKRKLLATSLRRTKKPKYMQDPEPPGSKVVVEKIYRVISVSNSTSVGYASQGLDVLETPVAAESSCKNSQKISVVHPASPSRSNVVEPTVTNSSDQSQYLNDSPNKIPPSSSTASVAGFLEHDTLEKAFEVLDFLESDALDILIENVMNIVNKLCGSYLERELTEYLGPITYQHIAEHERIASSAAANRFSSFDNKSSELFIEADKSIAERLRVLQKQEVPEENASWQNVEMKRNLLGEILNDTECDDQVKSASPPTYGCSFNEMESLNNFEKNTESVVLKGPILSPLKVNPSQLSQPSTAGASSTTQDGNPRIIKLKNMISGDILTSHWTISNDEKKKLNRVFYRITLPSTTKKAETKIIQNMYVPNESSSQKGQIGSSSAYKSVTELVQPEDPLIHTNPKAVKAEEVNPKKRDENPLLTLSFQTHPGTPTSNRKNQPQISVERPNQKSNGRHSVLKKNVVAGKLLKTPVTYVASPNEKENVGDSSQEPATIIRDTNTKSTALRCYSRSQLSAKTNKISNRKTPESQLSATKNKPTTSTGAHVKSGEIITITSEDYVKTVPEVAVKTTGQPELQKLDECDSESDLNCPTIRSDMDIDKSIDENCRLLVNQITTDTEDEVDCLETDSIEEKYVLDESLSPLQSMTTNDTSDCKTSSGSEGKKSAEINKVESKGANIEDIIKVTRNLNQLSIVSVADSISRKQRDQTGVDSSNESINVTKIKTYEKVSKKSEKAGINNAEIKTVKDSTHISKLNICTGNKVSLRDFRRVLTDTNLSNKESLPNLDKENIDLTNGITVKNLPAEISTKLRILSQRDVRISKVTSLLKTSTLLPCHIEEAKENQECEEIDKKPEETLINEKQTSKDNLHISELKKDPMKVSEGPELKLRNFCEKATDLKIDKNFFNLDKDSLDANNGITLKNSCGHHSEKNKMFSQKIIEISPTSLRCTNGKATTAFVQTEVNSKRENISNTGDKTGEEISKKFEEKCINKKEASEDNLHVSELKAETCHGVKLQNFRKEITDSNIKKTESFSNLNKENIDTNNEIAVKNSCGQDSETIKIFSQKIIEISPTSLRCTYGEATTAFVQTEVNSKNENISDTGDKPGEEISKKFEEKCINKKEASEDNLHVSELKAETCHRVKVQNFLIEITDSNIKKAESFLNVNKENIDTNNEIAVRNSCGQDSEKIKICSQKVIENPPISLPCNNEEATTAFVQTEVNSKSENISKTGDKTGEEISKKFEEKCTNKKEASEDILHVSELKAETCHTVKWQNFHKEITESNMEKTEGFCNVNKENIDTNNEISVKNSCGHDREKIQIFSQNIIENPPTSLRSTNGEATTAFVQTEINSKSENISKTGGKTDEEISKKSEEKCINKKDASEDNLDVSELKAETCHTVKWQNFGKERTDSNIKKTESFFNVNKENIDTNNEIAVKNTCFDNEKANTVFEPDDLTKAHSTQIQQAIPQFSENPQSNKTSKEKKLSMKKPIKLRSSKDTRKRTSNQRSLLNRQRYALIAKISMVSKTIQNRVRNSERLAHRIFNNKLLKRTLAKLSFYFWFLKARRISCLDAIDFYSSDRRAFIVPRKTQRTNRKADSLPVPIPQPKNMNVTHLDDGLKNGREIEVDEYTKPLEILKETKSDSQLLLGDSQEKPTAGPDTALRRSSSASKDSNEIIQCFFYEKPEVYCEENPLELKETKRMEAEQQESLNSLKNGPSSTCSAGTNNPKSKRQRCRQQQVREQTRYFLRKRGNNLPKNTLK
ncbi:uncharacterized protein LOC109537157 isoform X2 [Dendroctonus ponderosae]|uniref:uncharacterized protein LOC109537157 isoform X2 n=1 Tax=Dendroctonus ponderosae TaxID=77166 RepID=UPI002035F5D3|nr:uncharacterized protein LOC109537157 isoform X2 [Dendroctonus ponderosae]